MPRWRRESLFHQRWRWWATVALAIVSQRGCKSDNPPACCFSAADSPCATLSMAECEYHKFARCYIVNDTWGVPRCTDECGGAHCDPCCATQTCANYLWSCQFCECGSGPTLSGCCGGPDQHCVFASTIPLPNQSLFRANGTCCPVQFGGAKCDQCARGRFGADCNSTCPMANGRICNGFGTCADGRSGDGMCTCEHGHLIGNGSCNAVDPSLYNCSSTGGQVCAGHGQCTSMLRPKATGLQDANCSCDFGWLEPHCDQCKTGFGGANCDTCAYGFYAITHPGTGAIEDCELCPGAILGPDGVQPGAPVLGVCSTHGQCDDGLASNATPGKCFCDANFSGYGCEQCADGLAPTWNDTWEVVQQCIPCHTDINGTVCNGHGVCTNASFQHLFDNTTNTTTVLGECRCKQYWITDPIPHSPTYGEICMFEVFHSWVLVTVLPASVIILLVLLRKPIAKLFTICCRRDENCCCTACCVRHNCCCLGDEAKAEAASAADAQKRRDAAKKQAASQPLLDPVARGSTSAAIQAATHTAVAEAGNGISDAVDVAMGNLALDLDLDDSGSDTGTDGEETGPKNFLGDTEIRQEYGILEEQGASSQSVRQ